MSAELVWVGFAVVGCALTWLVLLWTKTQDWQGRGAQVLGYAGLLLLIVLLAVIALWRLYIWPYSALLLLLGLLVMVVKMVQARASAEQATRAAAPYFTITAVVAVMVSELLILAARGGPIPKVTELAYFMAGSRAAPGNLSAMRNSNPGPVSPVRSAAPEAGMSQNNPTPIPAAAPPAAPPPRDPNVSVKDAAVAASLANGTTAAVPGLLFALGEQPASEPLDRRLIESIIRLKPDPGATVANYLNDPTPGVRRVAAEVLGELNEPGLQERIVPALDHSDPQVRAAAARALGSLMDRVLKQRSGQPSYMKVPLPENAYQSEYTQIDPATALLALIQRTKDPDMNVRFQAVMALGRVGTRWYEWDSRHLDVHGPPIALPPFSRTAVNQALAATYRQDARPEIRFAALGSLFWTGDSSSLPVFLDALRSEDPPTYQLAALGLEQINAVSAIPALRARDKKIPELAFACDLCKAIYRLGWRKSMRHSTQMPDQPGALVLYERTPMGGIRMGTIIRAYPKKKKNPPTPVPGVPAPIPYVPAPPPDTPTPGSPGAPVPVPIVPAPVVPGNPIPR